MNNAKKNKAYKFGVTSEKLAAIFLRLKGYRVIAERYHNPKGEIDILAVKGKILAVVEVKARSNFTDSAYSITTTKQRKILSSLEWMMAGDCKTARLAKAHKRDIRFDAILVVPGRFPRHMKDAWRI